MSLAPLPPLAAQVDRLDRLGLADSLPPPARRLVHRAAAAGPPDALLVVQPRLLPVSGLAARLEHDGLPGFVVPDLTDVDAFDPIPEARTPSDDVYLVTGIDRGDHLRNRTPDEALPELTDAGRTPLTLAEGVHWLLHLPAALERNHCFMTIGSRLRRKNGSLDARTPALWISNGTGRDTPARRGAPKVGWCWAGNRHTWLGFASAAGRSPVTDGAASTA